MTQSSMIIIGVQIGQKFLFGNQAKQVGGKNVTDPLT